jgi:hypothetical protein
MNGFGYIIEECPGHPACNKEGFVLQHRLVMEKYLGRYLSGLEVVHHRDQDKTNNVIGNLELFPSRGAHRAEHNRMMGSNLDETRVREVLQEHTTKEAADLLGVHHQTLRNNFDPLLIKRRPPHAPEDPVVVELVRDAAGARQGIKEFARLCGVSAHTVKLICERNGIVWLPKSRKGYKWKNKRTTLKE